MNSFNMKLKKGISFTYGKSCHFAPAVECEQSIQSSPKLCFVHSYCHATAAWKSEKQPTWNQPHRFVFWKLLPLPKWIKIANNHSHFFCFLAQHIWFAHKAAEQTTNTPCLLRWSSPKASEINQRYHRSSKISVAKMLLRLGNTLDIPATWCLENNLMSENNLNCS